MVNNAAMNVSVQVPVWVPDVLGRYLGVELLGHTAVTVLNCVRRFLPLSSSYAHLPFCVYCCLLPPSFCTWAKTAASYLVSTSHTHLQSSSQRVMVLWTKLSPKCTHRRSYPAVTVFGDRAFVEVTKVNGDYKGDLSYLIQ